ncbi:ADP-ribose pyrophosphatase [Roseivivax sp. THAF40]|uniref:gamma-glutamylcyclotransferase n=1 Tax=unclassified Roseivivax TaxID=2639302 RepID=UPI0012698107|nr:MULTISPECIES: gamma-glutamylcyclotransferase [unclassified Roseivivax]QFS82425.1 ADP-ribose pyrophosphatase [Roseivivax sp. THAF197b]QFT46194.1 ADP-ribose pyrophosphatase [Roseivivax sp. THAF40]
MPRYFLYGTLLHAPLFEVVAQDALAGEAAELSGYGVDWVRDAAYPVIHADPARVAKGRLIEAGADMAARLDFYEAGFGYRAETRQVETANGPVEAWVYFPDHDADPGAPFDLEDWATRWGAIATGAAEEIMARHGRETGKEAHALWPVFAARAWGRQMAQNAAPTTLRTAMSRDDIRHFAHEPGGWDGFFRLRRFSVQYSEYRGGVSERLTREAFCAFDAALVLPYDPVTDQVLLIEQFRYGPLMRDDPAPWVLEPIAGLIDAGEDPAETARREASEEAQLDIEDVRLMVKVYASPGYSTEFFHCFLGLADLSGRDTVHAGLDEENEDIRSHVISFDRAMELVETGEINAGPLAMMLLWLARERPGLRAAA